MVVFEFSKKMPMLDQMISGLQSFSVIDCLRSNKKDLEPLFVQSAVFVPNADVLLESIEPEFSEAGSNRKDKEVDVFKFFHDFVKDLHSDGPGKCMKHSILIFVYDVWSIHNFTTFYFIGHAYGGARISHQACDCTQLHKQD